MARKIAGIPLMPDGSIPRLAGGSPVLDVKVKDQLKDVEARIDSLRDDLKTKSAEVQSAKDTLASSDGKIEVSSEEFAAAKQAVKEEGELKDQLADLQAEQIGLLTLIGESGAKLREDLRTDRGKDTATGWDSSALDTEEIRAKLSEVAHSASRMGQIELGEVASPEAFMADVTASEELRRGNFYGVLPQLQRPLRLLDLIPTAPMTANTIPFTREEGSFDGAAETAEGTLKPDGEFEFVDDEESARTIAWWMKTQKQSLEDFPALQGVIDNRLRYGVMRRAETQVAAGDGNAPNLRGIQATSGIGNVELDEDELHADRLLTGITQVMLADGDASGIALYPTDWAKILKAKADGGGDGQYYGGGPFAMTPQIIWGVPVVPVRAIAAGTGIVGDWGMGCQLFIRSGVRVLISDSDQDDFVNNKVTLLAEMRAAFVVFRPAMFQEVELGAPGS